MPLPSTGALLFGPFRLDPAERRLWRDGVEVMMAPKALEVLVYLAQRSGQVVGKEELFENVWQGTFVGDHALTVQIREIRRALDDQPDHPVYIETRHRRGYRFLANVDTGGIAVPPPESASAPAAPRQAVAAPRPISIPRTRYARSGSVNIAYQVVGEGPLDIVFVMGWVSHLEYFWTEPSFAHFLRRLASFSRLILFDKRGTGLSDRVPIDQLPTLEERMDDVRAVMDAVGSKRAVIVGVSEGGPMSALFAATHPNRTMALVMIGVYARRLRDADYPWGPTLEEREQFFRLIEEQWGGPVGIDDRAPSRAHDPAFRDWWSTYLRMGASPSAAVALTKMNAEIDVRHVLPAIGVPALVLHRRDDRCLTVEEGRYTASLIPTAKFVELPGADHLPFVGDQEEILQEIEDFASTARHALSPERVLATVVSADLAADGRGRIEELRQRMAEDISWHSGKSYSMEMPGPVATFDGPARAVRCAMAMVRAANRMDMPLRCGLHVGECEIGEGHVRGLAVDVATLLADRAEPGEVLATSTVRDLVAGSGLRFQDAGDLAVAGEEIRWRLCRVEKTGAELAAG